MLNLRIYNSYLSEFSYLQIHIMMSLADGRWSDYQEIADMVGRSLKCVSSSHVVLALYRKGMLIMDQRQGMTVHSRKKVFALTSLGKKMVTSLGVRPKLSK